MIGTGVVPFVLGWRFFCSRPSNHGSSSAEGPRLFLLGDADPPEQKKWCQTFFGRGGLFKGIFQDELEGLARDMICVCFFKPLKRNHVILSILARSSMYAGLSASNNSTPPNHMAKIASKTAGSPPTNVTVRNTFWALNQGCFWNENRRRLLSESASCGLYQPRPSTVNQAPSKPQNKREEGPEMLTNNLPLSQNVWFQPKRISSQERRNTFNYSRGQQQQQQQQQHQQEQKLVQTFLILRLRGR